ncbi:MAG TPA: ATP-binding protein [Candidatus Saccharimonadales bacterium]|nr:ATP-binding protein [Candidatus Saccharimonadales bacterium]
MQLASRRFSILANIQIALGAVIGAAIFATYYLDPTSLRQASLGVAVGGLGAVTAIYGLTGHQLLKKNQMKTSVTILSVLSGANILLVILASGGLDSPYYSLWLLGIVVAGFFGSIATLVTLAVTAGYFVYDFWVHGFASSYITGHIGQLAISLTTGGIAEWIHLSLGRGSMQHAQVASLSGKLSQEQLKADVLMQSVGEGVLVVNANRQIQLFNPAAARITGWDEPSAQGIDYRLVLNLHDAKGNKIEDRDDPFTASWREGKSTVHTDLTMETKGGHKIAIELSLSPIFDANHKVSGGIALFRDISAEKEIERQRAEFISTASHEMRTPVAAVEGYLSLAMNAAVATVDDRAKGYLEKAHASTQHLGELFRDLLSVTKLEDSGKSDAMEVFDLTKLVKDSSADMAFTAEKKGLEVQFSAAEQSVRSERAVLPIYAVRANPQRIREVVMNLIENAVKFTSQGSIHITIGGTADTVTVSVTDTGIGISPEDASHLFQKFYRVDNSATRTIGGTGLGLYLCRTIIEIAGGRIWVESKPGEGSAFRFSLPRVASQAVGAVPNPATASPVKPASPTPQPVPIAVTSTLAAKANPPQVSSTPPVGVK